MKYNNYAEKIVPILIEHHLIDDNDKESMIEFIRDNMGDEYA